MGEGREGEEGCSLVSLQGFGGEHFLKDYSGDRGTRGDAQSARDRSDAIAAQRAGNQTARCHFWSPKQVRSRKKLDATQKCLCVHFWPHLKATCRAGKFSSPSISWHLGSSASTEAQKLGADIA